MNPGLVLTGPPTMLEDDQWLWTVLEQANQCASDPSLDIMLDQMLNLILEVSGASRATLALLNHVTGELTIALETNIQPRCTCPNHAISEVSNTMLAAFHQRQPIHAPIDPAISNATSCLRSNTAYFDQAHVAVPLLLGQQALGVIDLAQVTRPPLPLIQLLCNRIASEIEKARRLQATEKRLVRMTALIEIVGRIGSTLDRDRILALIIESARQLLDAEVGSLFLVDEATGEMVLHTSSGRATPNGGQIRVPAGKGIIGHVVQTGETVLVQDAQRDHRHYREADQQSGFVTHSMVTVPLSTHTIALGRVRGTTSEAVIGGLQVLNKRTGTFDQEDAKLLEILATQAATVFEVATLYADTNELFFDVIQAMAAAIDAKDPYTQGHSQRVSDFAVAIAQELDLDTEFIHHVRIGGMLHDVGKIGVPDQILKKPGLLTDDEFTAIKEHPSIGKNIMGQIRMLRFELPALVEHHERLDGSGYPRGLRGDEISLMGRIIAVADSFDAMTSNRTYRPGMAAAEAFRRLDAIAGTQLDATCVAALWRAYEAGVIQTQPQTADNEVREEQDR